MDGQRFNFFKWLRGDWVGRTLPKPFHQAFFQCTEFNCIALQEIAMHCNALQSTEMLQFSWVLDAHCAVPSMGTQSQYMVSSLGTQRQYMVSGWSKPRASQFSHKNFSSHSLPLSFAIKVCGHLKREREMLVKKRRRGLATLAWS